MLITIIYMDSNKCCVPASLSFFNPFQAYRGWGELFMPSEIQFFLKIIEGFIRTRSCKDDEVNQGSYIVSNFVLMYVRMVFNICQGHIFF